MSFQEKTKVFPFMRDFGAANNLAFLVFSGAFNPVHNQQVRAMEMVRHEVDRLGWNVVAGFLAPSSDQYVEGKLGNDAWPLATRIQLCELATQALDWVSVCPWGEFSSYRLCVRLRQQLEREATASLSGRSITGIEIMGSDTAIRIIDPMLSEWSKTPASERKPWYDQRTICCVVRPGPRSDDEKAQVRNVTAPGASELGIKIILLDTSLTASPLEAVSSSEIRNLVRQRKWKALLDWLDPHVLKAIKNNPLL